MYMILFVFNQSINIFFIILLLKLQLIRSLPNSNMFTILPKAALETRLPWNKQEQEIIYW